MQKDGKNSHVGPISTAHSHATLSVFIDLRKTDEITHF